MFCIIKLPELILKPVTSPLKIGDSVGGFEPNVFDDCVLIDPDGTPVGLFIKTLPDYLQNLVNIADRVAYGLLMCGFGGRTENS